MAAPVINPTSSVLSYPQWQAWNFSFTATGTPYTWRVDSGALPPGMTLQQPWSGTGASSGALFTVTGHPFANGTTVVMSALTGGGTTTLAVNTVYYVVGLSVAGGTFSLATAPNGTAITFSAAVTAVTMFQPGYLSGAATTPGVYNVQMIATNGSGDSADVLFTIGIEAAAVSPDTNADIAWDFSTNDIVVQTSSTLNTTPAADGTPIFYVKEQDDLIARILLVKNSTVLDVSGGTLSAMSNALVLVIKNNEPERKIIISDGSVQVGFGTGASLLVHAKFTGDLLAAALSNYEENTGTFFNALAEFELTFPNPYGTIGGSTLRRTSKTFTIQVARDLGEGS